MKITKDQVKEWLGSEAQYDDAVEVLHDLLTEDYTIEMMKLDIKDSLDLELVVDSESLLRVTNIIKDSEVAMAKRINNLNEDI